MLTIINIIIMIKNDVPQPYGIYFQDSCTLISEIIIELHDTIIYYIIIIIGLVIWLILRIIFFQKNNKYSYKYILHGQIIEIIWTTLPALILLIISIPSFILLYIYDEVISPSITVKIIGIQWYWKYEYSDYINKIGNTLEYESYIIPEDILEDGQLRILDTDTSLILPIDTHIRFIVTSSDVIHDFAIPSIGIKIDATPGRLNQVSTLIQREGVFYGQCSELCGVIHSSIPIKIETMNLNKFLLWLNSQ